MVTDFAAPIENVVGQYGLLAIFIFLTLDAAMLMPLLPAELLMVIMTQQYAHDHPSLAWMILLATLAGTLGSILLYWISRAGGQRLFDRFPTAFGMSPRRREKLEKLFQRPAGQSLVLWLRIIPLTRLIVNIPAGLARMPFIRFVVLTFIGNLIFHAGFMYVTYESAQPESPVSMQIARVQAAAIDPAWTWLQDNGLLVISILLVIGVILSIRSTRRANRDPSQAYEGSMLATLATMALFWGGLGVLVGLYADPEFVYETITVTGYDPATMVLGVPYEPLSLVAGGGGFAFLLGLALGDAQHSAKRRFKKQYKARRRHQKLAKQVRDEQQTRGVNQSLYARPGKGPDRRPGETGHESEHGDDEKAES